MAPDPALLKSVKAAVNKYSRSSGKSIKPKEGRNYWRILAPKPEEASWVDPVTKKFWVDLGAHWIKTSKNGKPLTVVGSRDICFDEPCPVGAAIEAAIAHANHMGFDDETKEVLNEMKVQKSVLFNVINRTDNPDNQEVEIGEVRPSVAQQIFDLMIQYAEEGVDIFDLENGVDIVIKRDGKGKNTEYSVNVRPGASKTVKADAITKCYDLKDYVQKEYFRGEEQRALNAIQQIAGISLPRIGGPAAPVAAVGVSPVASAKAIAAQPATSAAGSVASVTVPGAMPSDDDLAEIVREVEANSQPAAAATSAPATTPDPTVDLDSSDVDDILNQLSAIGS